MFGRAGLSLTIMLLMLSVLLRNGLLFLVALTLLALAGLARLWRRYALERVSYARRFSHRRAFFGEEVELTIEVVNRKLLPLPWLEVEDEAPSALLPAETPSRRTHLPTRGSLVNLVSLRWYERIRRRYRIRCETRGEHVFGPVRLRSGDVFGFSTADGVIESTERLLVYPRIVPIARLGLPAADPFGDQRTRDWIFEDPLRVVGVRDYAPSDSPRRIHWKASARMQQLQVKLYEPTTTRRLVLFLNLNTYGPAWWWQGYDPDLLELAISVAASVASWAAEEGYQVGLAANGYAAGSGSRVSIPPSRDPDQLTHVLEALARLQSFASSPLGTLLRAESRLLPHGATAVVATAVLDEDTAAQLASLRATGHKVAVLLIGDDAPPVSLPGIVIHRIGGESRWRELATIDAPVGA